MSDTILVINAGSSSIKFYRYDIDDKQALEMCIRDRCLLYLGLLAVMMIQADTSANLGKPLEIEFQYQKF